MSLFSKSYPVVTPKAIRTKPGTDAGIYDYIVVGVILAGGVAGCVVASRLSEDPSVKVLVGYSKNAPSRQWNSLPSKHLGDGCAIRMLTGSCLGGGSAVNSMTITRGSSLEYDGWGKTGWKYADVEKYFLKSEKYTDRPVPDHHSADGLWINRSVDLYYDSAKTLVKACDSLGFSLINDVNTPDSPTVGLGKFNVAMDAGSHRCSAFTAYLPLHVAHERRSHLHVCPNTIVASLNLDPDTMRIDGVFYQDARNDSSDVSRVYKAIARKEVILCAGAINTPQILLSSGIGPKEELGHNTKKDLPGVGKNLQDHMAVPLMYSVPTSESFHILQASPLRGLWELAVYILFGKGLFTGLVMQLSLFAESAFIDDLGNIIPRDTPYGIPDIEIMLIHNNSTDPPVPIEAGILSFTVVLLLPKSTGTVTLGSRDPLEQPACDLNFLGDPADLAVLRKGLKLAKRVAEKMRELGCGMKDWHLPKNESDEDLDVFIRSSARTTYHYSSSCRMASEGDPRPGVVDDELRVHGVHGLRVADCSIMPDIIANHLQAPAAMIGEKCADMIKAQK
ncbi:alcohol oxidase [Armillaria mellea]|nr:alcohol oxidase [Armillaria mellea]